MGLLLAAAAAPAQEPADEPRAAPTALVQGSDLASGPREMFLKGVELADRGAIEEAKTVFKALTLAYPELPEAHINLAVLLAAEGDEAEAADAAEAAIRAHPVCRAAFDLEFQRRISDYSATLLGTATPAASVPAVPAVPSTDRRPLRIGSSELPRAASAAVGSYRVVREDVSCLHFRRQPSLEAVSLDCLPPGTWIRVRETAGDWGHVTLADGREGWMAAAYLAPGAFRAVAETVEPCLNFRPEPSLEAAAYGCLLPGVRVLELGSEGEWSRVVLADGREGWMATPYLVPGGSD